MMLNKIYIAFYYKLSDPICQLHLEVKILTNKLARNIIYVPKQGTE